VPFPLTGDDYIELLPVAFRAVNDYGITIDNRTYDCKALNPPERLAGEGPIHPGNGDPLIGPVVSEPYNGNVVRVVVDLPFRPVAAGQSGGLPAVWSPYGTTSAG
jgi:hypothetical protein